MGMPIRSCILTAGLLTLLTPSSWAQIRASERGSISQTIDGTTITIDYARPRIRGRSAVFGEEVKWEEVWTPGANMATTLEVSKEVQLNGQTVPKGKYSVWMVVTKGDWTVVLDSTVTRFHTDRPDPKKAVVRFDLRPQQRPRIEVLTWSFPEIRADGGVLAMQWDTVYVPLTIKVPSSYSLTVASDVGRPLVGSYEMRWISGPPGEHAAPDSARQDDSPGGPGATKIDITYSRGSLWAHVDPAPFPGYDTMVLLRMKDDWYIPGWWMNGELYDASDEMVMEFTIENGRATGFDLRTRDDTVVASASRTR